MILEYKILFLPFFIVWMLEDNQKLQPVKCLLSLMIQVLMMMSSPDNWLRPRRSQLRLWSPRSADFHR